VTAEKNSENAKVPIQNFLMVVDDGAILQFQRRVLVLSLDTQKESDKELKIIFAASF